MSIINFNDFLKIDIRVGKIVSAEDFPEARNPAYIIKVNLGAEIGIKKSSAQITTNYSKKELIGRLVLCVTNFPEKQIGPIKSQVLILGIPDENNEVVLVEPSKEVPLGGKLY